MLLKHKQLNNKFPEVFAFSTTKGLGSMGASVDTRETVNKNRKVLAKNLNISFTNLVFCKQIHDIKDALITNTPGICLLIRSSDCVPIILYDPKEKASGIAHAGRLGTVKEIGLETVKTMQKQFGSDPKNITAIIGPSIGPCCYEISSSQDSDPTVNDVISQVKKAFPRNPELLSKWHNNKTQAHFDLWEANKITLLKADLENQNIIKTGICSHCDKRFYSARRGEMANFATGIIIK